MLHLLKMAHTGKIFKVKCLTKVNQSDSVNLSLYLQKAQVNHQLYPAFVYGVMNFIKPPI